ncbi:MAG: hypothetical protein ACYCYP_03540 [Leptospirales bacterium]
MRPFDSSVSREDRKLAMNYAQGAFLRFSAMWSLAGFTGAFGTVFLAFSRGNLDLSPLFRELTVGIGAALLGLGHSRYQYYLLTQWPAHYAGLARQAQSGWTLMSGKGGFSPRAVSHPGRGKIVLAYIAGILLLFALILVLHRGLPVIGTIFFAEGGFFFARVLFWKRAFDLWKADGTYDTGN